MAVHLHTWGLGYFQVMPSVQMYCVVIFVLYQWASCGILNKINCISITHLCIMADELQVIYEVLTA